MKRCFVCAARGVYQGLFEVTVVHSNEHYHMLLCESCLSFLRNGQVGPIPAQR